MIRAPALFRTLATLCGLAVLAWSVSSRAETLTIVKAGAGSGGVTSSPAGIDCGSTCSANFAAGTVVTLTASASGGGSFAGWSGVDCPGISRCRFTLTAATTVTATFSNFYVATGSVTVVKAGTGTGTVTSSPAGIWCGDLCSAAYITGMPVTLTAQPGAGSTFSGWSGGGCSGVATCTVISTFGHTVTATFSLSTPYGRLSNLSTRGQVGTGDNVMIGGFVIDSETPKTVLVRARGPSLAAFGVAGAMADPVLQLYSGQTLIAGNDDWQSAGNVSAIRDTGFAPTFASESAILLTLGRGAYSAVVSGTAGGSGATGVGLVEVFEIDRPDVPIINLSTRGQVLTGDSVMIGGFVIEGGAPKAVLVTARGPSLAAFGVPGVLANPTLALYSGQTVIASNDNWQTSGNADAILASGFAPSHSLESAILVTLNPGAYTAIVTGVGGTTGVGIVEVFAQ